MTAALIEAVVEGGHVVHATSETEVPWWSFGKTVLAAAALVLVQQGRLDLNAPRPGAAYSLRQLLAHRAGLPDYGGLAAYHADVARGASPWTREEILERTAAERLRFPPGEGWAYSNVGYRFIAEAIEGAADAPLPEALQRLALRPLGITARVAVTPTDLVGLANIASGYDPAWVFHGLLVGSVAEAARWLDRYLAGGLLGPELLAQAQTLTPIGFGAPDRPVRIPGYGLGLMGDADPAGAPVVGHTGGGPGGLIVVRTRLGASPGTVAISAPWDDQSALERLALTRLGLPWQDFARKGV